MKVCNICFVEKPLSEFYVNLGMKQGVQARCKDCTKRKSAERLVRLNSDPITKEKERKRHRDKYHRLGYKDIHKPNPEKKSIIMNNYYKKYPERLIAKNLTSHLKTENPDCEIHHWSYKVEHAKDFIELSVSDHATVHRFLIYDQERYMYRRIDTMELLDTKERHLEYINSVLSQQNK